MARQRRKKSQKRKKSKKEKEKKRPHWFECWLSFCDDLWTFICVGMFACIAYSYFGFYTGSYSLKLLAKETQIESLAAAMKDLNYDKIAELVTDYKLNFHMESHEILKSSMNEFFRSFSEKISDTKQYEKRQKILELLLEETRIQHYDTEDFCICNQAIKYRLIDASKLILSSMTPNEIKQCFSHRSKLTNNSIFHQVTKSKSASIARLILRMNANNIAFDLYAERLNLDLSKLTAKNNKFVIYQSDIKQMLSPIDIELVISEAIRSGLDSDWFFAPNSEGFTGFDYLRLNHGEERYTKALAHIKSANLIENSTKNIAQSVGIDDCNFAERILHRNSCYPPIIYGWDEFDKYWKEQRPVIIKNALYAEDVSFDSLALIFGHLSVMVSEIPYAVLFGQRAWSIPIDEYMKKVMDGKSASNLYAFDKELIAQKEELQTYFNFSVGYMEEDEVRSKYDKIYQLALGPLNSGAPPHWHSPAFNGLFEGKKMWWMFAPEDSMYASMSAGQWIHGEYRQNVMNKYKHYSFIQEKGDVVFVPSQWAHAVNNLENSLAVAIEYDI